MEIKKFCKVYEIPNFYFYYELVNGKKEVITKVKDYDKLSLELIQNRIDGQYELLTEEKKDKLIKSNWLMLNKCKNNIICLDIDSDITMNGFKEKLMLLYPKYNKVIDLICSSMYTKANNKGLHIYLETSSEFPKGGNKIDVFNDFKGDILIKTVWEKDDNIIYNSTINYIDYINIEFLLKKNVKNNIESKKEVLNYNKIKILEDVEDNINIIEDENNYNNIINDERYREYIKYLNLFDIKKRFHNYKDWSWWCKIMKESGLPFDIFNHYSKLSNKYVSKNDCLKHWNYIKVEGNYKDNLRYFKSIAKKDNPEEFFIEHNNIYTNEQRDKIIDVELTLKTDKLIKDYNIIEINESQIDINKNINLNSNINNFFTDKKYKFLTLKSPYGTGKSHLLFDIIDKYNFERILFISYRQTLTSDIVSKFKKYNFIDYRTKEYNANRLVISPESLKHLKSNDELIPYQLIILDESESIINQFSSVTFNNGSRDAFNILNDLLNFPKTKCIALDGDLNIRTYDVLKSINNNMINIVNNYKHEPKTYNFIDDRSLFRNMIYDDIKKKVNVAVSCMSASYLDYLEECIKNDFKDIKVCKITSLVSDEIKNEIFDDINNKLKDYQVFLYSPTCEAGCDILLPYKLYSVICSMSCTSRSFRQMLGRIRKPINENNTFTILNYDLQYISVENSKFWTFDDVKDNIICFDNKCKVEQQRIYEEDKIIYKFVLTPYNTLYIYNKVEKLNNSSYFFIQNLLNQIKESGNKYVLPEIKQLTEEEIEDVNKILDHVNNLIKKYHEKEKKNNEKYIRKKSYEVVKILLGQKDINKDDKIYLYKYMDLNRNKISNLIEKINQSTIGKNVSRNEKVINSKDISTENYNKLVSKQKNNDATEEDKIAIIKHTQKKILIKDSITKDDLINYNYNNIYNYIHLSDITRLKNTKDKDIKVEERIKKIELIQDCIKHLGFKDINDQTILFKENVEKNLKIENIDLIKNWKLTQILFKLDTRKDKPTDIKSLLFLLHSILPKYHIDIKTSSCSDKNDKVKKTKTGYRIIKLNDIDNIVKKYNQLEKNKDILYAYCILENIKENESLKNDFKDMLKDREDEVDYWNDEIQKVENVINNNLTIIENINIKLSHDDIYNKVKELDKEVIKHYYNFYYNTL